MSNRGHPQLRFAIDNGQTLCNNCHKEIHGRQYVNI